ncbi:hypothetical protein [Frankia sp. AgB32]|uniref:hypothetical protein n=1 Tax=Frankia sp. AgB32 TaxID=631119 RepID=UPI00200F3B9A|nr:hypothetical protein [Frankia sp. AgB32]MCK9893765.1 hypothetical protein [Frankia sp. AgB32]
MTPRTAGAPKAAGGPAKAVGPGQRTAARPQPSTQQRASAGFDRLHRRGDRPPSAPPARAGSVVGRDAHGKRVLYSGVRPATAAVARLRVDCSRCGETCLLGGWRALRALTPSVHLPVMRQRHFSLVRCPACRRMSWVRLALHLRPAG